MNNSAPKTLYKWTVMPFGLTSSPSTFERLMELILHVAGLRFETCLIYLDDIIVYGKTFEEELKRWRRCLCALDLPVPS